MHNSNNSALSKDIIFEALNHTNINSTFNIPSSLEELSVSKAKEVLTKNLLAPREVIQVLSNLEAAKEATDIFNKRKAKELPANITETPKFHEAKSESVELSNSAKETFARIGARAREAFIEEQIERAKDYNIPYERYSDDYYRLMQDIDQYEFLLEKADELDINWDASEYDPIALEQLIEERQEQARNEINELRWGYFASRGVAV
ncbi:MAG: hypothetical protein H6911_05510 [Rickettsiaceae bacterium]|nr:hypothetical protein [Rickettsiaceae bacterium]MCP5463317.1 hypothetical protein [bacterium]